MTDTAPQPQPQPPVSFAPLPNVAAGLNMALQAAPELRSRPNLAVAAAQSPDPAAHAQVLAHASNLASLHQAYHDMAANKGGEVVLQRQLAKASGRYAKATGQSFWASLGDDVVHVGHAIRDAYRGLEGAQSDLLKPVEANPVGAEALKIGGATSIPATSARVGVHALGDFISNPASIKKAPGAVAQAINRPLGEVQHQYRYIHDVEARHGPAAAALASLGLLAGGIAGGVATKSASGAVLGAEAVEDLEARILYPDSWKRTAPNAGGYYTTYRDPNTHRQVSPGRDLASAVGLAVGSAPYNLLSGLSDFVFDSVSDPLSQAGTLIGKARSLEGAGGLLGRRFSGLAVNADNVDTVFRQYGSVRAAFQNLAGKSAEDIAIADPRLAPIAQELSRARDAQDVLTVIKDALRSGDLAGGFRAPTLTLTNSAMQGAVATLRKWAATPIDPGADPFDVLAATKQTSLVKRAVDTVLRSQTRLPEDWDPELLKFDSKSLDLMGDTAPKALYAFLREGESDYTARMTVRDFMSTEDPGQRLQVWHKAISDLLLARAAKVAMHGTARDAEVIFADPQILDKLQQAAIELSPEANAGGVYGADTLGNDISTVVDDQGNSYGAGILSNHQGRVTVPTLAQVKRAAQSIAGVHSVLGRADDFLYEAVTQRLFKRAVLLSMSFAEHIVAGEMIQSALRVGPLNMGRSVVADVAARLGVDLERDPDEAGIIAQAVADYGQKMDPERFSVAAALKMRHGTFGDQFAATGISAGHHFTGEVTSIESWRDLLGDLRAKAPSKRFTDVFGLFGHDPTDEGQRWAAWLNEIAGDPASKEAASAYLDAVRSGATDAEARVAGGRAATTWLDAQPETYLRNFVRHHAMSEQGRSLGLTAHEDWGRVIVDNMLGATTTTNGRLDTDLLQKVADGERTAPDELADRTLAESPRAVKGRKVEHYTSGALERLATVGHRKVLSPFINAFSRDPTYIEEVTRQMKAMQPLMDDGLGFDEAMDIAETRATQHMVRYVHNLNERTQFSELVRNAAPFFFAQQQAYKRLFRLAAENPGAFRRYQLGLQALANFGVHHTDTNGSQVVTFPGIGSVTSGMLQAFGTFGLAPKSPIPIVWQGALSSANVIAPFSEGTGSFRPDLGPLVSIPLAGLQMAFPELQHVGMSAKGVQTGQDVIADIEGPIAANEATPSKLWAQLVPNTFVQRIMEGVDPSLLNTYYSSAAHQIMAVLDYEQTRAMQKWIAGGKKGPQPQIVPAPTAEKSGDLSPAQQAFVNRVVNGTRVLAITKALIGLVTPLSPQLSFDKMGFTPDVQADIKKYGLGQGLDHFLANHPDASAFTVFSSDSEAGGAEIPSTGKAMDWIDTNGGFIDRNPNAALYFMPNSAGEDSYSQQAYNQQLAMGLRTRRTNQQFLQQVYNANGDYVYYNVILPEYDTAKVMAATGMGEKQAYAWSQNPKNAAQLLAIKAPSALTQWMNDAISALEQQNPEWGELFQGASANSQIVAQQALTGIRRALKDPQLPQGPQTDVIRQLVDNYDQVAASLPVGDSAYATSAQVDVQKAWREWLDTVAAAYPWTSTVIHSVFYDLGGTGAQ